MFVYLDKCVFKTNQAYFGEKLMNSDGHFKGFDIIRKLRTLGKVCLWHVQANLLVSTVVKNNKHNIIHR